MAALCFGADALTFGANPIVFGSGVVPVIVVRGDDAPSARRWFYDRQIEEVEARLSRLIEEPQSKRRRKRVEIALAPLMDAPAPIRNAAGRVDDALREALRARGSAFDASGVEEALRVLEERVAAEKRRRRRNDEAVALLLA